jgi:hypothetical protein
MDRLSSVKGALKKYGSATTVINTYNYSYVVKINDDDDYSFEIIKEDEIK